MPVIVFLFKNTSIDLCDSSNRGTDDSTKAVAFDVAPVTFRFFKIDSEKSKYSIRISAFTAGGLVNIIFFSSFLVWNAAAVFASAIEYFRSPFTLTTIWSSVTSCASLKVFVVPSPT